MQCPTPCPCCGEWVEHETMKPERLIAEFVNSKRLICRECYEELARHEDDKAKELPRYEADLENERYCMEATEL